MAQDGRCAGSRVRSCLSLVVFAAPDVTADDLARWADAGDTDDRMKNAFRRLDERSRLDEEAGRAEEAAQRVSDTDPDKP